MPAPAPDSATDLSAAPAPRAVRTTEHNFGLDLARFLAVSLVLVTHCSVMFLSLTSLRTPVVVLMSSFFGVELFFVLSGFLIGRLLFRIAETNPTPRAWLTFMTRRWLRTLPLYFLWLGVVPTVLPAPAGLRHHLLRYATMTQNLAWPMPADHWFNETWSLTIEEWFYLLFSVALLGAVALARSTKAIWPVIAVFIVVPPMLRALHPANGNFEENIYHIALFRLDAIAYGVALARLHVQGSRLFDHPRLAFGVGGGLIAACWWQDAYGEWLGLPWMTFLHLQLFAVSIGLCLLLTAMLRLPPFPRPLTWVISTGARISYGIYIMHLTIIATVAWTAAKHGLGLAVVLPVSLVLIAVLPYLSYRFYETPLLALRPRQVHPAALGGVGRPPRKGAEPMPRPHLARP